jgi:hypothetical protein
MRNIIRMVVGFGIVVLALSAKCAVAEDSESLYTKKYASCHARNYGSFSECLTDLRLLAFERTNPSKMEHPYKKEQTAEPKHGSLSLPS